MFIQRPSLFTRLAAVALGCIWMAAGAGLTSLLFFRDGTLHLPRRSERWRWFAPMGATAGLMLIGSGLRPWRPPKSFEEEFAEVDSELEDGFYRKPDDDDDD